MQMLYVYTDCNVLYVQMLYAYTDCNGLYVQIMLYTDYIDCKCCNSKISSKKFVSNHL